MGRRFGQLAGLVAFGLVLGRLGRLLESGPGLPRWNLILVASAFLGAIVWWLLRQTTMRTWLATTTFVVLGFVLFLRIAVPTELIALVVPGPETLEPLGAVMDRALALIRHGVPPVDPTPGIIAILAVVAWAVGALYTWGYTTGPAMAMVLPSIVLYLQFAILDRLQAGLGWMLASGGMLAIAAIAMALERRQESGRARDLDGRPKPARSTAASAVMASLVAVVAVMTANNAVGTVSEYGNLPWRGGGGDFGVGGSGVRLDPFVDLRAALIERQNVEILQVYVGEQTPNLARTYLRLQTLDSFNGIRWSTTDRSVFRYQNGQAMGTRSAYYQGTTTEWVHKVLNTGLQSGVVPVGGVPLAMERTTEDSAIRPEDFHFGADSSVFISPDFSDGQIYQVRALHANSNADLGALATGADGELSGIFANAAEQGRFDHQPSPAPSDLTLTSDELDAFTQLPADMPASIGTRARSVTAGATTDFERAWMLQHWLRDSGSFTYDLDVADDQDIESLDDWLNDPAHGSYRRGYCQQFALSMAAMARTMDIPSRVVIGFTPGDVNVASNGARYVSIRDINYHAWVEVFIDGFGWVQFDPTPRGETQPTSITAGFTPQVETAQPAVEAPTSPESPGFLEPELLDEPTPITPSAINWWLLAPVVAGLLVLAVPLLKRARLRRRAALIRDGDITALWDEIVDRLEDIGEPVPATKTPLEFARDKDDALVPVAVAYSASVYGGRETAARDSDLYGVETWYESRYERSRRLLAAVNPRSLWRR